MMFGDPSRSEIAASKLRRRSSGKTLYAGYEVSFASYVFRSRSCLDEKLISLGLIPVP